MASQQRYSPAEMYIGPSNVTWTTTGNSDTHNDINLTSTSTVLITNTALRAGSDWKVIVTPTVVNGSTLTTGYFTVTSTDSESAGLTYSYKII